ncbi:hypothetical protein DFH07DRAFT_777583 [Mycena maculata]|uniref:Uncharacterized protein n=1 Tax=Mycena maculata TaxID=230809 RepID=A0AAD7IIE0_9AGAR|nr:hypothetical protein DFH07DRAFT_777583 [Mycena maculata]
MRRVDAHRVLPTTTASMPSWSILVFVAPDLGFGSAMHIEHEKDGIGHPTGCALAERPDPPHATVPDPHTDCLVGGLNACASPYTHGHPTRSSSTGAAHTQVGVLCTRRMDVTVLGIGTPPVLARRRVGVAPGRGWGECIWVVVLGSTWMSLGGMTRGRRGLISVCMCAASAGGIDVDVAAARFACTGWCRNGFERGSRGRAESAVRVLTHHAGSETRRMKGTSSRRRERAGAALGLNPQPFVTCPRVHIDALAIDAPTRPKLEFTNWVNNAAEMFAGMPPG